MGDSLFMEGILNIACWVGEGEGKMTQFPLTLTLSRTQN